MILFSIKETIHSKMRVQSVSANVKVNSGEEQTMTEFSFSGELFL